MSLCHYNICISLASITFGNFFLFMAIVPQNAAVGIFTPYAIYSLNFVTFPRPVIDGFAGLCYTYPKSKGKR